jgi:hypothetical protein
MSLRTIADSNWEWAASTRGTVLLVHLGNSIAEYTWKEWMLLRQLSAREPYMVGPRNESRQYCLYGQTLYTCPSDWWPGDVLERIQFPGTEDQLQEIRRMAEEAHDRLMTSAAAFEREAQKNLKETMDKLFGKRSRYIPNRSKIAASIRTNGLCMYCNERPIEHFEHIIPFSKGGSNEPWNIGGSCRPCNLKKGDKMPWEWEGRA